MNLGNYNESGLARLTFCLISHHTKSAIFSCCALCWHDSISTFSAKPHGCFRIRNLHCYDRMWKYQIGLQPTKARALSQKFMRPNRQWTGDLSVKTILKGLLCPTRNLWNSDSDIILWRGIIIFTGNVDCYVLMCSRTTNFTVRYSPLYYNKNYCCYY